MSVARKFTLKNENGVQISLNGAFFLSSPEGLGWQMQQNFENVGNFWVKTKEQLEQPNITGEVVLRATTAYADYKEISAFISAAKKLTLEYTPGRSATAYWIDIAVEAFEKSEIGSDHLMRCPVSFRGLAPWARSTQKTFTFDTGATSRNIKQYPYRYAYTYATTTSSMEVEYTAGGDLPSIITLTLEGPVSGPILTATETDSGAVVGKLDLSGVSATQGEAIKYISGGYNAGISLVTSSGETDLINAANISDPLFFELDPGQTVRIALTVNDGGAEQNTMTVQDYFRAV